MSSGSEVRILRDEIARLIAEIGKMKREFATRSEELATQLAEATARIAMLEAENLQLRQHIKYYENPHTPSSQNSIPTRQKKAAAKASGSRPAIQVVIYITKYHLVAGCETR